MDDIRQVVLRTVDKVCSDNSGFCTGDIANLIGRQPGHESNQQHSALIGRELRALEKAGLVGRLDDKKPVVWVKARTPEAA